ncbi:serine/threonine protein kinase [Candidatus Uabimicrobium sp. HlEnr_7]|uniref:serine/threonine protein kinase n=1 Tax=Candidatus Uabimicrobium helgolandensis TaxID=3095367 RepID=UPI003557504F
MGKRNSLIVNCVQALNIIPQQQLLAMQSNSDLLENLHQNNVISLQQKNYIHFLIAYYVLLQGSNQYGHLNEIQVKNLMQSKLNSSESENISLSYADKQFIHRGIAQKVSKNLYKNQILVDKEYQLIQSWLNSLDESKEAKAFPKIGNYQILELIGSGGMGRVYKAQHPILRKEVAIKVLINLQNASPKIKQRFHNEACAMAQLEHPHIVQIHDTGTDNGISYIVMDYIAGISLRELTTNNKVTIRKSCNLISQILQAVYYAHNQGIIHRDLKPSNLLLKQDKLFLMDFGLAKDIKEDQNLTNSGQLLGTLKYMSPEQAEGKTKKIDRRTDIYATGVIFYEMLTGVCPIQGTSQSKVIHNILYGQIKPMNFYNKNIPNELEAICCKAMAKSIEERYQNAEDMRKDIRLFLEGKAISIRSNAFSQHIKRHKRKYIHTVSATVFTLLFLTIGIAVGRNSKEVLDKRPQMTNKTKKEAQIVKKQIPQRQIPYLQPSQQQLRYFKYDPKEWELWENKRFKMRYHVKRSWQQKTTNSSEFSRVIHSSSSYGKAIFYFSYTKSNNLEKLLKTTEVALRRLNQGILIRKRQINVRIYDLHGKLTTYFLEENTTNFYLQVFCAIRNNTACVCIARRPQNNLQENVDLFYSVFSITPFD